MMFCMYDNVQGCKAQDKTQKLKERCSTKQQKRVIVTGNKIFKHDARKDKKGGRNKEKVEGKQIRKERRRERKNKRRG